MHKNEVFFLIFFKYLKKMKSKIKKEINQVLMIQVHIKKFSFFFYYNTTLTFLLREIHFS